MRYLEYTAKIERIKELIRHKATGTPLQLAKRLEISLRSVLRMIQQLKDSGYRIIYNRNRCTLLFVECLEVLRSLRLREANENPDCVWYSKYNCRNAAQEKTYFGLST